MQHNSCNSPEALKSLIDPARVHRDVYVREEIFKLEMERTLRYSRLINSPASMVGPDDLECYLRIQESAETGAIEWIDMHRHHGREQRDGDKVTGADRPRTTRFPDLRQPRPRSSFMRVTAI